MRRRLLQRKCACGGTPGPSGECDECRKKRLQRKSKTSELKIQNDSLAPPIVHEVLRSPGQALDQATRTFMEPRFGHDFSAVRVHTGAEAVESAQAVGAIAYTVGRHIVFGKTFRPQMRSDNVLLAHELTHVVQQGAHEARGTDLSLGLAESSLEREAEAASRSVEQGMGSARPTKGPVSIARQADPNASDAGVPDGGAGDAGSQVGDHRDTQVECVKQLGGCANIRPGGLPTPEEIVRYNQECREKTGYNGPDVTPTDEECRGPAPPEQSAQAWICARPLHYPALSLVFNHAYVSAPPQNYAIIAPLCTPTDGGSNSLLWNGTAARKWDNSRDPCGEEPECVACRPKRGVSDVKQCLRAAFDAYNSPVLHIALGPNSNTFAGTLARTCCDGIVGSPFLGITPGWDDPPAPSRAATCSAGPPSCS